MTRETFRRVARVLRAILIAIPIAAMPGLSAKAQEAPLPGLIGLGPVVSYFDSSTQTPIPVGRFIVFPVAESARGADLNGDSDLGDTVIQLLDRESGEVQNTGLVPAPGTDGAVAASDEVLLVVTNDGVRLLDGRSGSISDPGLDGLVFPETVESGLQAGLVVVIRYELLDQLAGVACDANGDGDCEDFWFSAYRIETGETIDFPVALPIEEGVLPTTIGGLVVYRVSEREHGNTDLNSDGDASDLVLHVWSTQLGQRNLGIVASSAGQWGSGLWLSVPEESTHADLNGDGDQLDGVLHVFDPASSSLENLGLAGHPVESSPHRLHFFQVSEQSQGQDFDGDGALRGFALHLWDARDRRVERMPGIDQHPLPPGEFDLAMFLHDDGAFGTNRGTLYVYSAETRRVSESGISQNRGFLGPQPIDSQFVVLAYDEVPGEDLNHDGDLRDSFAHVVDRSTGSWQTVEVPSRADLSIEGGMLFYDSLERFVGDQNGDGDIRDRYSFVCDVDGTNVRYLGENARVLGVSGTLIGVSTTEGLGLYDFARDVWRRLDLPAIGLRVLGDALWLWAGNLSEAYVYDIADADGDGVFDAEERELGTNPSLDDTDGDGLSDGEEVAFGTDPLWFDSDEDGIGDGSDPSTIATVLETLPGDAWRDGRASEHAARLLDRAHREVSRGRYQRALQTLDRMLRRVDGCECEDAAAPDRSGWIVDCSAQARVHHAVSAIARQLGTVLTLTERAGHTGAQRGVRRSPR